MKYLLILLLAAGCCPSHKMPPVIKKDTTTGHWQYTHDEDMEWVKDSVTTKKGRP